MGREEVPMPRYFFHEHVRGERTEDPSGTTLPSNGAACHRAMKRTPANLKKAEDVSRNTHVATEVTNGERTLFIVRGKVTVEKQ
jgi:hypothetical protein